MRRTILAALVSASLPLAAYAQIVRAAAVAVPDARINPPMPGFQHGSYRANGSPDRADERRDVGTPVFLVYDADDRVNLDQGWVDRLARAWDGVLAYDRDYPFDARYGGEGEVGIGYGGYAVTDTTVTTEPSVVHRIGHEEAGEVFVHRGRH